VAKPQVSCQVFVSGGGDPTNEYESMFVMVLKPKGYVFPEHPMGAVFEIGQVAGSVLELREYLASGCDIFDGEHNWNYFTKEEEDQFVRVLPAPFDDPEVVIDLIWSKSDVILDKATQLLCDLYDRAFSELELQKLDLGELRVIRAVKGGVKSGHKKADLIDDILGDQKSKGLSAIRVMQKTLEVIS
jgi:hypothetical protein